MDGLFSNSEYRNMVNKKMAGNSPEPFASFSMENAGYIRTLFLDEAEYQVDILAFGFEDLLYGSYPFLLKKAAERLHRNGGKIRVVTINGEKDPNLEAMNQIDGFEYIPAHCKFPEKVNFYMVVDGKRYHLEQLRHNGGYSYAEVCCFGPKKAAELISFFDELWNSLTDGK